MKIKIKKDKYIIKKNHICTYKVKILNIYIIKK